MADTLPKSKHPLWETYRNMLKRCYYPKMAYYANYGGSGITVCNEWRKDFYAFLADMGERPMGYQLDRIDSTKGYGPENCRWVEPSINLLNRKKFRNTKSLYKGVYEGKNGRWLASIKDHRLGPNSNRYLGTFLTQEEAAKAYDEAALELHGEHAKLNFP